MNGNHIESSLAETGKGWMHIKKIRFVFVLASVRAKSWDKLHALSSFSLVLLVLLQLLLRIHSLQTTNLARLDLSLFLLTTRHPRHLSLTFLLSLILSLSLFSFFFCSIRVYIRNTKRIPPPPASHFRLFFF